jgi:hypothetical protein
MSSLSSTNISMLDLPLNQPLNYREAIHRLNMLPVQPLPDLLEFETQDVSSYSSVFFNPFEGPIDTRTHETLVNLIGRLTLLQIALLNDPYCPNGDPEYLHWLLLLIKLTALRTENALYSVMTMAV